MFTKQTTSRSERSLRASGLAMVMALALLPTVHAQQPMAMGGSSAGHAMAAGDMKKSMEAMHQQMTSMTMTGDADHDFAMMMRIHHQGALKMAQAELANGKDPEMRKMARNIITAQKKEIGQLDRWLKKHERSAKTSPSK